MSTGAWYLTMTSCSTSVTPSWMSLAASSPEMNITNRLYSSTSWLIWKRKIYLNLPYILIRIPAIQTYVIRSQNWIRWASLTRHSWRTTSASKRKSGITSTSFWLTDQGRWAASRFSWLWKPLKCSCTACLWGPSLTFTLSGLNTRYSLQKAWSTLRTL